MNTAPSRPLPDGDATTTKTTHVYRVFLDRPLLDTLVKALPDRSQTRELEFRTTRNGTEFTARTLDGLLTRMDGSLERDFSGCLNTLTVTCRGRGRSVTLVFADNRAAITACGRDPVWVGGKVNHLSDFLIRAGGRYRLVRWGRRRCGTTAGAGVVLLVAALSLLVGVQPIGLVALACLAGALGALAGYLIGWRRESAARLVLYVTGPMRRPNWWQSTTFSERILIVSTLVALAGVLAKFL